MSDYQDRIRRDVRNTPFKVVGIPCLILLTLLGLKEVYVNARITMAQRDAYKNELTTIGDDNSNGVLDNPEKIRVWKRMGLEPKIANGDTTFPKPGLYHLHKAVESYRLEGSPAYNRIFQRSKQQVE